jgi:hypothetical protein
VGLLDAENFARFYLCEAATRNNAAPVFFLKVMLLSFLVAIVNLEFLPHFKQIRIN